MNKQELGQLVCYMWANIDQASCMSEAENAFRNCPKRIQLEILDIFVSQAEDNPKYWLDKPEYVNEAINKAKKMLDR